MVGLWIILKTGSTEFTESLDVRNDQRKPE